VPLVLQNKEYGENYQDKTLEAVPELFFGGNDAGGKKLLFGSYTSLHVRIDTLSRAKKKICYVH